MATIYFDRDKEVSGRAAKAAEKQKLIDKEKQKRRAAGQARRRRGGQAQ